MKENGVLPSNDIPAMQKRLDGKMVIMGGIDADIVDRQILQKRRSAGR